MFDFCKKKNALYPIQIKRTKSILFCAYTTDMEQNVDICYTNYTTGKQIHACRSPMKKHANIALIPK